MRDGFREIISGWWLTDDVEGIGEYIEASARWVEQNGGRALMAPDERGVVHLMIKCQVARSIRRGDFEPFIPSDLDDTAIADILNFGPVGTP